MTPIHVEIIARLYRIRRYPCNGPRNRPETSCTPIVFTENKYTSFEFISHVRRILFLCVCLYSTQTGSATRIFPLLSISCLSTPHDTPSLRQPQFSSVFGLLPVFLYPYFTHHYDHFTLSFALSQHASKPFRTVYSYVLPVVSVTLINVHIPYSI